MILLSNLRKGGLADRGEPFEGTYYASRLPPSGSTALTGGVERAVLFTGADNVPAVKAYAALSFRRIGDYRIVLLR